jgi:hypothetical protein
MDEEDFTWRPLSLHEVARLVEADLDKKISVRLHISHPIAYCDVPGPIGIGIQTKLVEICN